jgi:alkanesulfonate monooxygenase SsuD/methylene tetrahydromethanopterin reductase-like flavin-dependent oxidoreductase (luciferase family)
LRTGHRRRAVLGTAAQVRDELEQIAAEYGAQELIIVTITHDHALRRRSYELLAAAFELEPRDALATVQEG